MLTLRMKMQGVVWRWVLPYLAIILLAVACAGGNDDPQAAGQRMLPTPTLMPGLPTSTPLRLETRDLSAQDTGSTVTATRIPPPTPGISPTPTPRPSERVNLGQAAMLAENYPLAVDHFKAALRSGILTGYDREQALMSLGQAHLHLEQFAEAADAFGELLALSAVGAPAASAQAEVAGQGRPAGDEADAYFFLGQANEQQADCRAAIGAFESYLAANPNMAAYIQPRIAACYLALGEGPKAIQAYEAAAAAPAERVTAVGLRQQLAQTYLEQGNYPAAIEQLEAILTVAETDNTKAAVTYQLGTAELLAGNTEAGYARYLEAVNGYPKVSESYQALIALIEAGYPVDDFQRGLVDFYAKAYDPALVAFQNTIDQNPEHREEVHLYLAWIYEALGNTEAALAEMDIFIEANVGGDDAGAVEGSDPELPVNGQPITATATITPSATITASGIAVTATVLAESETGRPTSEAAPISANAEGEAQGWIERAKLLARAQRWQEAADSYQRYLERFPAGEQAPFAAWWAAALAEILGQNETAISRYQALADGYPEHQDAPEALFRAGFLSWQLGENEAAIEHWQRAAQVYPASDYGAASLLRLIESLPRDEAEPYLDLANDIHGESYYAIRVRDVASGTVPFSAPESVNLGLDSAGRDQAETWLRKKLDLDDALDLSQMSEALSQDGRLERGMKLWQLGLRAEAKRELESLRLANAQDALASYQLALFFRDLGLYRSSILAAASVLIVLGDDVFTAPPFISRLLYPAYYTDLVLAESERYGFDPLLQLALLRQESLFESFATSTAVAQGLSQVIPDTGAYIARRLNWPDYANEDLYRPYVGVAFGAYYLAQQLESFDGFVPAALSAYNGGPGNAARWYALESEDLDSFVETVDFSETRQYIQRIYAGQAIYRALYGE